MKHQNKHQDGYYILEQGTKMKTHTVLQPLFDIVNKIHANTFLPLDFSATTYHIQDSSSGERHFKKIYWYIGEVGNELYGKFRDRIDIDDLDEDKLNAWVDELTVIYEEEMGLGEEPEESGKETDEEIARHENHAIDSQEDTQI